MTMADPFDPARYVPIAAAALGLTLAPEDLNDVIAAFSVIARVAKPVMSFDLPEDLVPIASFIPEDR